MSTKPKPFVFVLMPFNPRFDDAYRLAIKPACEAAGAYAERVDEQVFNGSILERIYNQISKADVVVADLTDRNSNVFYEVGYAHALGKTTVLLTRSVEDIPFDLKHYPHIVYEDRLLYLKEQLEGTVRWHVENPARVDEAAADIFVRVNGVQLSDTPLVPVTLGVSDYAFQLTVELENRVSRVIAKVEGRLGLVYPNNFNPITSIVNYQTTDVVLDGQTRLCLASQQFSLLPGQWWSLPITLSRVEAVQFKADEQIALTIRLLRPSGVRDIPFKLQVQHRS